MPGAAAAWSPLGRRPLSGRSLWARLQRCPGPPGHRAEAWPCLVDPLGALPPTQPAASAPSAPLSRSDRPRQVAGSEEGGLASGPVYPHRRPFLPPARSPGFWGRHEAGQLLGGHEIRSGIYRVINVARAQGLKKWSAGRLEGAPRELWLPWCSKRCLFL